MLPDSKNVMRVLVIQLRVSADIVVKTVKNSKKH